MHGAALRIVVVVLALSLAACASGGSMEAGGDLRPSDTSVVVRVRNNLVPQSSAIVSVVAGTRPERVLGTVPSDATREWLVETRLIAGSFVILAETADRHRLVSRPIDVLAQAVITWELNQDIVRVERAP
ncbi:MAG: hypothetical protein ACRELC_08240 [Gemmatimonadota bacterium]